MLSSKEWDSRKEDKAGEEASFYTVKGFANSLMHKGRIVDRVEYETRVSAINKMLVRDFLIEKKAQNRTPDTLVQYEANMRIILTILLRHYGNKELTKLTRKDVRNLAILFHDMNMSNARVNSLLSTLRSALEYFTDDDELDYEINVGAKVKGLPKKPIREITFLNEEQIEWLKNELLERGKLLEAMYLMLSYISAARKGEVHQVLKAGLTERYVTNTVIGKGGKRFKLYYGQEVQQLITQYLEFRGPDDLKQLFVKCYKNGKKRTLHKATYNAWCDYMGELLSERDGREIHINPHAFRHSRITNLSRMGVPLSKLKTLANHNDVSTTESYIEDNAENDIAEIFNMDASCFR